MRPGRASRVPTEGAVLNLSTGGISPFETASRPSSLRGMALSTMFGKYIGRRVPGMSFLKPALTLMLNGFGAGRRSEGASLVSSLQRGRPPF